MMIVFHPMKYVMKNLSKDYKFYFYKEAIDIIEKILTYMSQKDTSVELQDDKLEKMLFSKLSSLRNEYHNKSSRQMTLDEMGFKKISK